jgi:hypothetical protein
MLVRESGRQTPRLFWAPAAETAEEQSGNLERGFPWVELDVSGQRREAVQRREQLIGR